MVVLGVALARRALTPPFGFEDVAYQVEMLGVRSLSLGALVAMFAGLVISLQFAFFMPRFGIQHTVGKVVVLTLFRELAPVLTALTVGARIGSGITAELGSMKVTEQIDAIRALGADPVKKLVAPRVLACMMVLPALTALADVFGLRRRLGRGEAQYEIPLRAVLPERGRDRDARRLHLRHRQERRSSASSSRWSAATRASHTGGGTEGVGRATTETVAIASVAVLPRRLLPHQAARWRC